MPIASGVVALPNNAPPNDKNNPPPEGLYWGDGELKAPKRPLATAPGLKGVFTDSVIARLPEVPVEEDAVAQLFATDARLPAPSLTPPPPAKPNAFWHEPGNTLQGGVPGQPGKPLKPAPAAAAAAMAGAVAQRTAAGAGAWSAEPKKRAPAASDSDRRLPAGALGAPVVGDFGMPASNAARRNSLPAGALREGRTQKQTEQAMEAAARAEAAAQQTRTLEMGGIEPSGLELDIPPANANARGQSGAPAARGRPQIQAVVDKNALGASMRAGAGAPDAATSLRASGSPDAATSLRASAQGAGASLRTPDDGLSLQIDAADAAFRGSTPLGAGGTLRAGAGAQSKNPQRTSAQAGPPSLRSQAASTEPSDDDLHAAIVEGDEAAGETSSYPPGESSSLRPKSGKERRAEARRAARRKAAKHLPPPPTAAPKSALDPAKITLLSFAAVLGIGALGIAAAEAGYWELPPRAAAMLGVENARASLSSAKPGAKPHLVMPAEPAKPKPQEVVVAAPAPAPAPTPAEAQAEPAAADPTNEAAPQPTAAAPQAESPVAVQQPVAAPAVEGSAPSPVAKTALRLNPPPGALAPQSSAATSWSMVPSEEPPAPLMLVAPESAAVTPSPTGAGTAPLGASPAAAAPNGPVPPSAAAAPAQATPPAATAAPATAAPASANAAPSLPSPGVAPANAAVEKPAPATATSATSTPANLASATAPGTMPAALAATPKAVVTLSPTAAPSGGGQVETEEFTLEEAAAGATTGDRAVSAKLVALARNKLKSRDAAGAAELMLRQVTADPEDHHAMEVLIRAWIAMGRGDDAVGYAELIVKKRPRRAGYRVLEGDARLAAGDPAGAQVAWRVALQLEPENVEAKRRLGLP